ncbi:MAG: hypothetical protein RLZZ232_2560 [Planctomycetota bacterium]|jgi:hypothetical protein
MLNQQIVAFRSVETDIQPFTAEPDTQTTLLHQVENAPELPYGHRFGMPRRGPCQAANQTGSDRTPLPIPSVFIRGFKYNHQTTLAPAQLELRPPTKKRPCFVCFVSFVVQKHPKQSVIICAYPWFQRQPPNHTRTGSGGTSPSHFICPPIPFALPSLAAREGPPAEGN